MVYQVDYIKSLKITDRTDERKKLYLFHIIVINGLITHRQFKYGLKKGEEKSSLNKNQKQNMILITLKGLKFSRSLSYTIIFNVRTVAI